MAEEAIALGHKIGSLVYGLIFRNASYQGEAESSSCLTLYIALTGAWDVPQ